MTEPRWPSDSILATCPAYHFACEPFLPPVCVVLILGHPPPPLPFILFNFQLKDFNIGFHLSLLLSNFLDTPIFSDPASGKGANTAKAAETGLCLGAIKKRKKSDLGYRSCIENYYMPRKVKDCINTLS